MDAIKTTTRTYTYMGSRAVVTIENFDSSALGLRRITMEWLDDAPQEHGGFAAGTITTQLVKGDGRLADNPKAFQVIEALSVVK